MVCSNNSSSPSKPSCLAKSKPSKTSNSRKASKDRHLKVDGRDRRVRLPVPCAQRVFELNKRLGHRTAGQTIEWLLMQAKSTVDAVLGTNQPAFAPHAPGPASLIASYPYLGHPAPLVPNAGMIFPTQFTTIPVFAGEKVMSGITPRSKGIILPPKCGVETENMEISAEEIAKLMFQSSSQ